MKMWLTGDKAIEDKLQVFLGNIIEGGEMSFPQTCPVCKEENNIHLYFNRSKVSRVGGVWVWCGKCKHYFHGSFIPPIWWTNLECIPQEKLESAPCFLNSISIDIDSHINQLLRIR
ncbi:hypothetical protein QW71_34325 [Paenibacillus sp. IHB B 3415]|uniref:hypothetical protein n=1 Tax=Paenibacillus sp. IHB B 3415 TaxID=867080 RepID=UPI0005749588|nr:hypothetical protein [Paenibacillus sp. IHB B 3415]KHL91526.1 hypothetical protein QW71_34325 [Paenibacillus sp. IHB B 3415]